MSGKKSSLDLTEGPIAKRLLQFFVPILLGMLLQQLYNTVDAIVIGKFEGTYALGAVGGSTATLINLIIGIVTGLASGSSVVLSQLYGSRDEKRMSRTVHTIICFYFLVGVGLTVLGYFITPGALSLVNTPEEIMPLSTIYMRIYFVGSVPLLLYNIGSGILRAVGDSKHPLYFLVVCCILNIFFNLIFVAWLKMGVAGVAWGTVIAQAISAVMAMSVIMRSKEAIRFSFKKLEIDWPSLWRTLHIGIPSGIQASMYSVSNMIIQTAINGLGAVTVAGWTAQGKLTGVYWVTTNAFNIAICAFVGQCFGAGKYDRLKKSMRIGMTLSCSITLALTAALLLFGRTLLHLFTDDPEVIEVSYRVITLLSPGFVCYSVMDILAGILRGVGETLKPTLIVIIGICVTRILWVAFIVPHWNNLTGISLSYPSSWLLTMTAMIILYAKTKWLEHARLHDASRG